MSLESQAKLLRVLEEKEIRRLGGGCDIKIDVRIISSINTMPQIALQKNQLREDLFYRLSVTTIVIPANQRQTSGYRSADESFHPEIQPDLQEETAKSFPGGS